MTNGKNNAEFAGADVAVGAAPEATPAAGRPAAARAVRLLRWSLEVAIVATVLYAFVFQVSVVRGESMDPTLRTGDRLVVDKLSVRLWSPKRFDVVVVRAPDAEGSREYVKRVIGLPCEQVELRGSDIYVDGRRVEQSFPHVVAVDFFGPERVPEGCLFVLGDNRPASADSRAWGPVRLNDLRGIVRMRIVPVSRAGLL